MTFPIVLLIAGLILLLIGLLGKIRMKEVEAGSDNNLVRAIVSMLGIGLLVAAFLFYKSETRQNVVAEGARPAANVPTPLVSATTPTIQPSPTATSLELSITGPKSKESVDVAVDDGAALIPVSGLAKGFSSNGPSNAHVYVFTNTGPTTEWWYNEETDPDQDDVWRTVALAGSHESPVKDGQQVTIRAVIATDPDIKAATKGKKVVKRLNAIQNGKISEPVIISLKPKS
jgi:hypothetical protein